MGFLHTFTHKFFLRVAFLLAMFLIVSKVGVWGQNLVVDFTSNPPASNNTISICLNQAIVFTNTSSNIPNNATTLWTFNGGSPNTSSSTSSVSVVYPTAGTYSVKLKINNDSLVKTVVVGTSVGPQASLNLTSNSSQGFSTTTYNGLTLFRRCGNGVSLGNFQFSVSNFSQYPSGTSQTIDWGDGQIESFTTSSVSHLYGSQGEKTLTYTVTYPNGCTATTTYLIFVGNGPPSLGIAGNATSTCLGSNYSYFLNAQSNPIPGTTYQIIYNDGSPTEYYNTFSDIPTPTTHVFNVSSCGNTTIYNTQQFNNTFNILVNGINGCSPTGTIVSVGPMSISTETQPSFTTNPENTICVNSNVVLTNTSFSGENVDTDFGCDSTYGRYWEIIPNNGFSVLIGSLGSSNGFNNYLDWTNGSDQLQLNFTIAGNYVIKLNTGNKCGSKSITDTICVMPGVVASFNPNVSAGCAPLIVNTSNQSSTPTCGGYSNAYNWTVNYSNPENCGSFDWSFANGSSATSSNPSFQFNEA